MRIAVIADTHMPKGSRALSPRCVEVIRGTDLLLHAGDFSTGRLARLRGWFPAADAVVFGHSHLPLHERDGGFQIFNPGSPTERRRAPRHSMGLATVAGGELRFEHVGL
jgi:uncharacterized protein